MARIGFCVCGVCGFPEASVTKNDAGTLSVRCHRCEFSGFAKAGTTASRKITDKLQPDPDALEPVAKPVAKPKPAAKPEEKPEAAPVQAKATNSVFSLGQI